MAAPARIAHIVETDCIGCTKCIDVCPVDAILGASKQLHTVLKEYCIGCELCLPPCPLQCIEMKEIAPLPADQRRERALLAKKRVQARKQRLQQEALQKAIRDKAQTAYDLKSSIAEAVARAQEKRRAVYE